MNWRREYQKATSLVSAWLV